MLTPHDKLNLINALKKAVDEAEKIPTSTPCTLCAFFRFGDCAKWKSAIPANVLETGCEEWIFDLFSPPF